jgi:hypothetical protein
LRYRSLPISDQEAEDAFLSPPSHAEIIDSAKQRQSIRENKSLKSMPSTDDEIVCYDGAIMMSRTQITLESEFQRRARRRASELGVSFAEYVRRLVERDLALPQAGPGIEAIFCLGGSGGSNIARDKDAMIGDAVDAEFASSRRRNPPSN